MLSHRSGGTGELLLSCRNDKRKARNVTMKRILMRSLICMLCLTLLCGSALAGSQTVLPTTRVGEKTRTVYHVAAADGQAWMTVYTGGELQLWRWSPWENGAQAAAGGLIAATIYSDMNDLIRSNAHYVKVPDTAHAVSFIFSDGERLYGLNHHTGLVFTIGVEEGETVFSDVTTLQDLSPLYHTTGDYRWYNAPDGVACTGDHLLVHYTSRDLNEDHAKEKLVIYDLRDGSSRHVEAARVEGVSAYRDGKALVITRDTNEIVADEISNILPMTINVCDPADGSLTPLRTLEDVLHISGAVYCEALDALLWQDGTSILGVKPEGEKQRYAYIPTQANGQLAVLGDTLVFAQNRVVHARTLVEGYKTGHALNFLGGTVSGAANVFAEKYPDVPLYVQPSTGDTQDMIRALTAEEDASDVVRLYADAVSFPELAQSGCLLDLSGYPAIAEYTAQLYPVFRDYVTDDGAIYGVPVTAGSYNGFFINRKLWEKVGFTGEDIPTNLVELCAFITRWNDEYALKYPDYAALDGVENYRRDMVTLILESWTDYCEATGQPLHFDDPVLRELLNALAGMRTDKIEETLKVTDPEKSDYKTGLIWQNCQLVGNWAAYMEKESDRIFIPMTLTEDTPLTVEVQTLQLLAVSAGTKEADNAVKLLEEFIAGINDKYRHVLLTTQTDPVENTYFGGTVRYMYEELAQVEAELAAAGNTEALEKYAAEQRARINEVIVRDRYAISPSAIENYVSVLTPAMYIGSRSVGESALADFETHVDRLVDGRIDGDQFILEAEAALMMLELKK